ncbi:MAG: hypothetical protein D0530_04750 [Methylococcales bacterium]|nr:MAG: hypothetical protein D0530_04750 [Methylococcales bacterium]
MPSIGWYNLAENTTYPVVAGPNALQLGSVVLAKSILLDAGFVLGAATQNPSSPATAVWLSSVAVSGTSATFHFVSDADPSWEFVFTRTSSDKFGHTEYVDSTPVGGGAGSVGHGFGFLVTGDLAPLFSAIPLGSQIQLYANKAWTAIEPALVQTLYNNAVTRIHIANDKGAGCSTCDCMSSSSSTNCPPVISPDSDLPGYESPTVYTIATNLEGDIALKAGYNTELEFDVASKGITISAGLAAGEGEPLTPCLGISREFPYSSSSSSLVPNPNCAYEYMCYELVNTINGIQPDASGNFTILSGPGVTVAGLVVSASAESAVQECKT